MILGICIATAIFLIIIAIYIYYFRLAFARKKPRFGSFSFSGSKDPEHKKRIQKGLEWFEEQEKEDIFINSYDGLKLYGRYIKCHEPSNKYIIMFHGYRSSFKDFSCAFEYYCSIGFNMIVVDQRSHGKSEGKIISYGVKEKFDVVSWVDYTRERFGKDAIIFIDGISMGASTVMMSSDVVKDVSGIIADCGYTSPKEIVIEVARSMGVPKIFIHPVGLMARIFGGFDYTYSTIDAISKTNIPIIFIHGLADDFVPSTMTKRNYEACTSNKKIVLVENATHGYSFLFDEKRVKAELESFVDDAIRRSNCNE